MCEFCDTASDFLPLSVEMLAGLGWRRASFPGWDGGGHRFQHLKEIESILITIICTPNKWVEAEVFCVNLRFHAISVDSSVGYGRCDRPFYFQEYGINATTHLQRMVGMLSV